jgi:TonB family protein
MSCGWIRTVAACTAAASMLGAAKPAAPQRAFWEEEPTRADLAAASAAARGSNSIGGRAAMRCRVAAEGRLADCRLISETPSAAGYGAALLSLAPKYRRPAQEPAEVVVTQDWFPFDTPGDWKRKPSAGDLMAVWPVAAAKRGLGGAATIDCVATVQGTLTDCVVVTESPPGAGFGQAAVALTPQFLMKPATLAGKPTPSTVRIPINFKTDGPIDLFASRRVAPPNLAWAEAPSYADVAAAYPKKARAAKLGGKATVACDMTSEGRLTNCQSVTSEPRGMGFDNAALGLAKQFRFNVRTDEERAAARQLEVHVPFVFDPGMLESGAHAIGKPSWAGLPSGEELAAAFPKDLKGTLRTVLDCEVQPGGSLADCKVVSEEPAGAGVGEAALRLSAKFRLTTWTVDGLPTVGGRVRIPLRYEGGS